RLYALPPAKSALAVPASGIKIASQTNAASPIK
ncbi:MAG: hypothetical protein ACI8XV_002423, partial [Arenicella sp.]